MTKCIECKFYNYIEKECDADSSEIEDPLCIQRLLYWVLSAIAEHLIEGDATA